MALDELTIIDRFFRPLAGEGAFGLNDDAARLSAPPDCDLVVTVDMIACGIHFLPRDPADLVARKALRVNLSDLAAKGAKPLAYVLSLGLPGGIGESWLTAFAAGLRADQERYGVGLLGGDTIGVETGPVVSITAFGAAPAGRMVHRFGGKPGDRLYVSGVIGRAAAGLAILTGEAGPWDAFAATEKDALVRNYRVPEPRVSLAPVLAEFASAAMDISDGLVGDCDKLAAASGCAATIHAEAVPLPDGLPRDSDGLTARLLTSGDDYAILAAVPPDRATDFRRAAKAVGEVIAAIGVLSEGGGPTQVLHGGKPLPLESRAYMHGTRA